MPQEFQVLQCFKCSTFQVHQVKKSNKWNCKLCGEKQSVKKVFGRGSGSDCRCHVQKLNSLRGEIDAEQDNRDVQNSSSRTENEEDVYSYYDSHRAGDSCVEVRGPQKWSKYLDGNADEEEDETDDDNFTTSWQRFNMFNKPNRKRKRGNSNDTARARKYSIQRAEEPSSTWNEETYSRYDNSRPNSSLTGPSSGICDNRNRNQDEPSVFDVNSVSSFGQDRIIEDIIGSDLSGNENIPVAKNDQEGPQGLDDLHMAKKHVGNRMQTLSYSSRGKLSVSSTRKQRSVSSASKWDKFTEKTEDSTDDDNDDTRLDFISGTEATALLTKNSTYDAVRDDSNNCSPKIHVARESSFPVQSYSGINSQIKGYSRVFISGVQSSTDDILLSIKNVQNTKENINPTLSRPSPTLSRPSPTLSTPCLTLCRPSPTLCRPNFSVGNVEDTDLDLEI